MFILILDSIFLVLKINGHMRSEQITIYEDETYHLLHTHIREIHAACSGCLVTNVQVTGFHKKGKDMMRRLKLEHYSGGVRE